MNDPHELIRRSAKLARLGWTDAEAQRLAPQVEVVLQAFEVISKLDVSDVEPTCGATLLEDIKRQDLPRASEFAEHLIARAPEMQAGCFAVPRAIEPIASEKGEGKA